MIYILAVYAILVVLEIFLIKKHPKLFYFIATVILSSLAYFVVVNESSDLYRYINMMDYMRSMGFEWAADNYGSTNPLAFMFFYILSLIDKDALLPVIAVFTTYGFSFAVLHKASKRFNASVTDVNVALIFFMLNMNYFYVVDVIRIYMAFAIMAYFLYIDIVEKKHRILCFTVYLILCYFHYAMLAFLLLRIILMFTRKFKGSMSAVVTVLVPLVIFGGYKFLEAFTGGGTLLGLASDRLLGYQEYETFGIWQFAASMIRSILFLLLCFAGIWICSEWKQFEIRKNNNSPQLALEQITSIKRNNDYTIYALYTVFTVFIFITNYQFVLRTPYFIQIMMSFVLLMVLKKLQQYNSRYYTAVRAIIVAESLMHFAYLLLYVYRSMYFAF